MEQVAKKYKGQAEFLFVYCREAHAADEARRNNTRTKQGQAIKQADTPEERKAIAQTFCDDMKMSRRIVVDNFGDKSAQRLYGGLNNPTVVVDVNGAIALKMAWTKGEMLDGFLKQFLAGGGRYDSALARSVPAGGPGGRPGAGRAGPSAEVVAPMIERMLDGITLTDAETKATKAALQTKLQLRGRLRVQALDLDELARGKKATEAELAKAIQEFETAVAAYQKQATELDRGLGEKVSAKAKAQLLAAGVFENGFGFLGRASGGAPTSPGRPGDAPSAK